MVKQSMDLWNYYESAVWTRTWTFCRKPCASWWTASWTPRYRHRSALSTTNATRDAAAYAPFMVAMTC